MNLIERVGTGKLCRHQLTFLKFDLTIVKMMESIVKPINESTIHQLCSSQVVVDLSTAVKELVENALDAGATCIEVKLKNMGADLIEVADNGLGIDPVDYSGIAEKHQTSKLQKFEDLENVLSFGFRGEALNALCELSGKFCVTTKRSVDIAGASLMFDRFGRWYFLLRFIEFCLMVFWYSIGWLTKTSLPEEMELLSL